MTISIQVDPSRLDNKVAKVANSRASNHREEIQMKSKAVRRAARARIVASKMMS
jgi:hypothetical protein